MSDLFSKTGTTRYSAFYDKKNGIIVESYGTGGVTLCAIKGYKAAELLDKIAHEIREDCRQHPKIIHYFRKYFGHSACNIGTVPPNEYSTNVESEATCQSCLNIIRYFDKSEPDPAPKNVAEYNRTGFLIMDRPIGLCPVCHTPCTRCDSKRTPTYVRDYRPCIGYAEREKVQYFDCETRYACHQGHTWEEMYRAPGDFGTFS